MHPNSLTATDSSLTANTSESRRFRNFDTGNRRILKSLTTDRYPDPQSPNSTTSDYFSTSDASQGLRRRSLNLHLIPSRQSSLKPGPDGSMPHQHQRKFSIESNTATECLAEDEDSEANNATIRRIRELQEARGRRQRELRREARKANKNTRRGQPRSKSSKRNLKEKISQEVSTSEIDPELHSLHPSREASLGTAVETVASPSSVDTPVFVR